MDHELIRLAWILTNSSFHLQEKGSAICCFHGDTYVICIMILFI